MDTEPAPSSSRTQTGVSSGSSSNESSRSAIRYGLDETDTSTILAYYYGKGKIEKTSKQALCQRLDQNRRLRVSKMPIPRQSSTLEVRRHDLYLQDEKELYQSYPNYDSSLATIKLPFGVYLSRNMFGSYEQLFIVSPELSPTGSVAGSFSRQDSDLSTSAAGPSPAKDVEAWSGAQQP